MRMTQLILQHCQQIPNHTNPLLQQPDSLVHLQIAPHSLVDRVKLRLRPHELGSIQYRTLKVDVDAEDKELADLHVYLASGEVDAAGACDGTGDGLSCADCGVQEVFV